MQCSNLWIVHFYLGNILNQADCMLTKWNIQSGLEQECGCKKHIQLLVKDRRVLRIWHLLYNASQFIIAQVRNKNVQPVSFYLKTLEISLSGNRMSSKTGYIMQIPCWFTVSKITHVISMTWEPYMPILGPSYGLYQSNAASDVPSLQHSLQK